MKGGNGILFRVLAISVKTETRSNEKDTVDCPITALAKGMSKKLKSFIANTRGIIIETK